MHIVCFQPDSVIQVRYVANVAYHVQIIHLIVVFLFIVFCALS